MIDACVHLLNILIVLRNIIFSRKLLHERPKWLHRKVFLLLFFILLCVKSISLCIEVFHMYYNTNVFLPLKCMNNMIVTIFIELLWQMEFVVLFHGQVPIDVLYRFLYGNKRSFYNHHWCCSICLCISCHLLVSSNVLLTTCFLIVCSTF